MNKGKRETQPTREQRRRRQWWAAAARGVLSGCAVLALGCLLGRYCALRGWMPVVRWVCAAVMVVTAASMAVTLVRR